MADKQRQYRTLKPGEAIPSGPFYRVRTKAGYIMRRWCVAPHTYVQMMEHRVVAGVVTRDHVHHINGIKDDNRPENLQVISHGDHSRLHHKIALDEAQVCRLYAQGESTVRLAERYGVSDGKVASVLESHGIKRRKCKEPVVIDYDAVKDMHARGIRGLAMQRRLGIGRKALHRAFADLGLSRFPVGMPVHWSQYAERERI